MHDFRQLEMHRKRQIRMPALTVQTGMILIKNELVNLVFKDSFSLLHSVAVSGKFYDFTAMKYPV